MPRCQKDRQVPAAGKEISTKKTTYKNQKRESASTDCDGSEVRCEGRLPKKLEDKNNHAKHVKPLLQDGDAAKPLLQDSAISSTSTDATNASVLPDHNLQTYRPSAGQKKHGRTQNNESRAEETGVLPSSTKYFPECDNSDFIKVSGTSDEESSFHRRVGKKGQQTKPNQTLVGSSSDTSSSSSSLPSGHHSKGSVKGMRGTRTPRKTKTDDDHDTKLEDSFPDLQILANPLTGLGEQSNKTDLICKDPKSRKPSARKTESTSSNDSITSAKGHHDLTSRIKAIKTSKADRKSNSKIITPIIHHIANNLGSLETFKEKAQWKTCNSGSYYEMTKISCLDEYDCILFCEFKSRLGFKVLYYNDLHIETKSYAALKIKSKFSVKPELCSKDVDDNRYLSPKAFKQFFRESVSYLVQNESQKYNIRLKDDDGQSPAVTLILDNPETGQGISIDLVPAIQIDEWPEPAKDWECKRLKTKTEMMKKEKTVFLVPKIHPSEFEKDKTKTKLWRLSFSDVEKRILLHADGKDNDTKENAGQKKENTCRKQILRLLKQDLDEYKKTLPGDICCVCSFYLKTTILHLLDSIPSDKYWSMDDISNLPNRYVDAVQKVIEGLRNQFIEHYFIRGENLLSLKQISDAELEKIAKHFERKLVDFKSAN